MNKYKNNIHKIKQKLLPAFTLAEVLLTLTIVGIVAALTIPVILQDIQDKHLKASLKNEYSTFNQAFTFILNEQSGNVKGMCGNNNNTCVINEFKKYLTMSKICYDTTAKGNCWHQDGVAKNLKGQQDWLTDYNLTNNGFILQNGVMAVVRWPSGINCDNNISYKKNCGSVVIDINGFNPPNMQGKDIFYIMFDEDKMYPGGTQGDYLDVNTGGCSINSNSSASGLGCTAKYLKE